ncbi:LOW QUALITY PROTEIN: cyclin-dependent kinase inhibitor 3 [Synchiropus picturatus]
MHCSCGRHHSALDSAPALLSLSGGHMGPFAFTSADMRKNEFDSSSDEDEPEDAQTSPLNISWMPLSIVESCHFLGVCALPGCRYKDIRRNLQRDVEELQSQGVQDVFVFCTNGELSKYRVPSLLATYEHRGFAVHHFPFLDGDVPELPLCSRILEELQGCLQRSRRTVLHCYGGLGRSGLVAACLLIQLSPEMTAHKAIEFLREHRGRGAIQTVKQYNFLHEFREKFAAHQANTEAFTERSVSR